ncbi:MAG: sigma factor-like helix-turn-helix DNA-binding protein [Fusobacterium sp.]|nr:sigma factor-like helix-turn-helix DNA-binding protein [Fusobacterium sp.]
MELSEFLEVSTLLDYYKNLLSDKQREYLVNHFEEDLSLSEIAKSNSVSRQAVYDNIKRGIKLLKEYEEKLGFYKRERELYSKLKDLRDEFKVEKLDNILDSYFS